MKKINLLELRNKIKRNKEMSFDRLNKINEVRNFILNLDDFDEHDEHRISNSNYNLLIKLTDESQIKDIEIIDKFFESEIKKLRKNTDLRIYVTFYKDFTIKIIGYSPGWNEEVGNCHDDAFTLKLELNDNNMEALFDIIDVH